MEEKELIVCVNGEYLPRSSARIDPFDYGWRRGWVVYDAPEVWKGLIFKLDKHIDRLWDSMLMTKIEPPLTKQEAKNAFIETVRRNGLRDAVIWMYVSRGVLLNGGGFYEARVKPTYMLIAIPYMWFGGIEAQQVGMKVIISSVRSLPRQCIDPNVKHINRLNTDLADIEAEAANAGAPILLDIDGYVTENNACNIWVVKNGKLCTPSADRVLPGIARETVFEIAQREGIPASEENMTSFDLYTADEVFFSGTGGGIIPIVELGGRKIGEGRPGLLTKRLTKLYWEMHESGEYGTPVY